MTPASAGSGGRLAYLDPTLAQAPASQPEQLIIQARSPGAVGAQRAAAELRAVGGQVTRSLPIIGGVAGATTAGAARTVATRGDLASVVADQRVHVQAAAAASAAGPAAGTSAAPPSVYRQEIDSVRLQRRANGGAGVTVALIDTGIDSMPDLAGRLVTVTTDPAGLVHAPCMNFTGEPDCTDSYGHGTFLAGLIAGSGRASGGTYTGVAPQARLLSVKIAGRDGSADVSTLLAAIQWVVSFRQKYGIKVLNLSLGTDSTQTSHLDPLNFAVEQAWSSGIAVIVAASNRGPAPKTITKPGDDPWVITVGAIDDFGTPQLGDDHLPNFSSHGPTAADGLPKPDVVAPGAHLVSLAAPGAAITTMFPSSMTPPYRAGSGTSMSTAVTSGVVALMLAANPSMTPDRVKYALMSTARPDASHNVMAVGKGIIDAYSAVYSAPAGLANQGNSRSTGLGPLQASRGTLSVRASSAPGTPVIGGNLTLQLQLFLPVPYTSIPWTPATWVTSQWVGSNWEGSNWEGSNWEGSNWEGSTWQGVNDPSSSYGSNWEGSAFYGAWDR
jgi:serine protease AprX